jgi:drug/metabolite transporter (DMT)-like permease
LEVILAPIWVWFFLGETASIMTFVGGVIVLAAVTLNALAGIGGRKAASQPGAIL